MLPYVQGYIKKTVPSQRCSQQSLWIIFWVVVSGKRCCCWVYQIDSFWRFEHREPSAIELHCSQGGYLQKSATRTRVESAVESRQGSRRMNRTTAKRENVYFWYSVELPLNPSIFYFRTLLLCSNISDSGSATCLTHTTDLVKCPGAISLGW